MSSIDTTSTETFKQLGLTREPEKKTDSSQELGQDAFMDLMIAQMRNQDPLNPMENEDFMAQLAQFSTVSGVEKLNSSFESFSQSMQSNRALQASGLVGRAVLVPGNSGYLGQEGVMHGGVELPASTNDLRVNVFDSAGERVRQLNLGPQAEGDTMFTWDGRKDDGTELPAGEYRIEANAFLDDNMESVETVVYAGVESVSLGSGSSSPVLNLAGMGSVDLSQVREIR